MASEQVVSLGDPGGGRVLDWQQFAGLSGTGALDGISRGGAALNLASTSGNWGLAGGSNARNLNNGIPYFDRRGGWHTHKIYFELATSRPVAPFAWPVGLYVVEGVFLWPTNLAGVAWTAAGAAGSLESGLQIVIADGYQPVIGGANYGISIGNDGGVLKFLSRNATGGEVVNLPNAAALNTPNKIRVELRNATAAVDASVTVYVNDRLSLTRTYAAGHKLPVPVAAGGTEWLRPQIGQQSGTEFLLYRGLRIFAGPDVPAL